MKTRAERRRRAKAGKASASSRPRHLVRVPELEWPPYPPGESGPPSEVWWSRTWVVQVYRLDELGVSERITVSRTTGLDGITWDELQAIKAEIGRGGRTAVELYPADHEVVNLANMRHLWTVDTPPAWRWRPRHG